MSKSFVKKCEGFTLVELLVVLTILALLITISIVAIQRYQIRAVNIRVEGSLAQIRNLAAMIYSDDSNYNNLCDDSNTLNDAHPRYKSLKIVEDDIYNFTGQYPICYSVGIDYCAQTILVTTGGSFCIDATGYAGEEDVNCGESNIKCSAP